MPSQPLAESPAVFVAGFGWSGASALVDALTECESANLPDVGEMRFLKALRKVSAARGRRQTRFHAQEYAKAREAIGAYSRHHHDLKKFHQWTKANRRRADFEQVFSDAVTALAARRLKPKKQRKRLTTAYLNALLFAVERRSKFTICDNLIPASQLNIFRLLDLTSLPPVIIFVVRRKPRDMFIDQIRHGWRQRSSSYSLFLLHHLAAVALYKMAIARIQVTVIEVAFEDFVCNQKTQTEVRDVLSQWVRNHYSVQVTWCLGSHFFPEVSKANVGLSERSQRDAGRLRGACASVRDVFGGGWHSAGHRENLGEFPRAQEEAHDVPDE